MGYYKPLRPGVKRGQRYGANPGWGPNPPGGHNGDDYLAEVGEPVYAAGDGEVIFAGQFDSTYADNFGWNLNFGGPMVILNLDGPDGPYVEYGHLEEIFVKAGDRVRGGQVIALSGDEDGGTGVITGPHLHVGVLPPNFNLNTNTYGRVDPDLYLTEYWTGGINYAGAEKGDDDMPITDEDAVKIARVLMNYNVDRQGPGVSGTVNLGAVVAWYDANRVADNQTTAEAAINGVLNREIPWYGWDGKQPAEGRTQTTLAVQLGWLDTQSSGVSRQVAALQELVRQLSIAQGVTIDYQAIAKAVNDDAAARMAKR